jgi:hypothetical protein
LVVEVNGEDREGGGIVAASQRFTSNPGKRPKLGFYEPLSLK